MLSDKELVDYVWSESAGDVLSLANLKYCAGLLKLNYNIDISPQEIKKRFRHYFKGIAGINPDDKCPLCQKELRPRKSKWGYFVGCSACPNCKFIATSSKPFSTKKSKTLDKARILLYNKSTRRHR